MIELDKLPSRDGYEWRSKLTLPFCVLLYRDGKRVGKLWTGKNKTMWQRDGGVVCSIDWVDPYAVAPDLIANVEAGL